MKAWRAESRRTRVWLELRARGSATLHQLAAALPDIDLHGLSKCLSSLKAAGYAALVRPDQAEAGTWHLMARKTPPPVEGEFDAATAVATAEPAPSPSGERDLGDLAAAAAPLLRKHRDGLTSDQLATMLQTAPALIDEALAPALHDRVLMSCMLMREGARMQLYRLSAGPVAAYDWRAAARAAWSNRGAELVGELIGRAVARPEPAAPPAQPAARSPQPAARSPEVSAPLRPAQVEREVAGAIAEAEPGDPAAALQTLDVIGEIDMDALNHKLGAVKHGAPEGDFLCALYSNGELVIDSTGGRVTLPLEHTRKLFHYLAHLGAIDLVEELSGDAGKAAS